MAHDAVFVRYALFLAMVVVAVPGKAEEPAPPPARASVHKVRPGETLWGISERYSGHALRWPTLQKRNGVDEPRTLKVGQLLQLDNVSAVVMAATGDVRVDGKAELLMPNDKVREGSAVRTGPDSFVTLRMPDGSRSTFPSNSVVRLVRLHSADGQAGVQLQLDAGDLEAHVPPKKDGQPRAWEVRTGVMSVGVRGTYFRVSRPNDGAAAVSVLQSAVAVEMPGHKRAYVPEEKGLVAASGAPAGEVRALLPAPVWRNQGMAQDQPRVRLQWNAVEGAESYHVQLARDSEFNDPFAEQHLLATHAREFAFFDGVPAGNYFARVAAVSADGLKGMESISSFSRAVETSIGGTTRWMADEEALEFSWTTVGGAMYTLEVADNPEFDRIVLRQAGLVNSTVRVQSLSPGSYWWRVTADIVRNDQRTEVSSRVLPVTVNGVR